MDNSGFVSLNFGMNVANSQAQSTSQILQQLPGIQQIFAQNASVKPSGTPQNVIQQAVLPVNSQQPAGNQTVMAAQTGLQFIGQSAPGFMGQQQQVLAQQAAAQQVLGPRGIYTANYQLMPRNYALVNQGVQGAGVTVQLSPQQIGTASLSPLEHQQQQQQHFLHSAGFDPQLAALQQNQQQIAFQNANGQLMIQSPTQQLMLQSPNQQFALQSPSQQFTIQNQNQFAVQSPNIAQFTPQQQLLSQGQGNNVIVQGQNGGMILQGENFVSQGLNQSVFVPNPGIIQNVNQLYGNTQSILASQIPGLLSQSQVMPGQNMGIISVNQSPTGNGSIDNLQKASPQNNNSGITNQQMQLLAHIAANQGSADLSQNLQNQQNMVNQTQNLSNSPNQSLPSFGHFLLHHHMQSLPHPFLQNLALNSAGSQQTVVSNSASDLNVMRNLIGASNQTATLLTSQCVPNSSSNDNMQIRTVTDNNINAEFNSWNIEQFSNQTKVVSSTASSVTNTKVVKSSEIKPGVPKLCSSKQSITTSNAISTGVVTTLSNSLSRSSVPLRVCTNDGKGSGILQTAAVSAPLKQSRVQDVKPQGSVSELGVPDAINGSDPKSIMVPFGWVRALEGDSIVYYSPTCTRLTSAESVRQYLVTDGTCKCGLDCPLHIEKVFNFCSEVISIKWTPSSIKDTGNLCNHKRKLSALTACQSSRSGLSTRPDVSLVTNSGMMSPRVSSTVQENQGLYQSNKKLKVDSSDEQSKVKTEHEENGSEQKKESVSSSGTSVNEIGEKASEDIMGTKVISDNAVSTSSVDSSTVHQEIEECSPEVYKVDSKEEEKGNINTGLCNVVSEKGGTENVGSSSTHGNLTDFKTIPEESVVQNVGDTSKGSLSKSESTGVSHNVSNNPESAVSSKEMVKSETINSNAKKTKLLNQNVQSANMGLKSPVISPKTDKKLSSPKSKSPVRSRSRSSITSRLSSDLPSPGSERSSLSRCSERSLSPRNDQIFSSEMFSHFMNFCGVNPSDLPPVFQQNFTRVHGASPSVKSSSVRTGAREIPNMTKPERIKLPVLPENHFGPFQANVLANLHKLSSPPNQQVFPPFNLPRLPGKVQGGYQHGASMNHKGSPQPAANVRPFPHNQGSRFPFGSMFPDITFGGTHPQIPDFVWLSPDSKRKSKSKKVDCEKIEDLFDSGAPPPNVDVSQLKDKGHGPIPKEKIASFLENPTEFLKQQTELVHSSISSTSLSPASEKKTSENTEDGEGEKTRSDSACSDRLNSPFKPDKEISDKDSATVIKPGESKIEPTLVSSQGTVMTQNNITTVTSGGALVVTSNSNTTSGSTVMVAPVASAPPTPTTVVHHTPGSLSCHQMSLIKARQHALGLKEGKLETSKESLLHPLAAILNDPTIGQVFQQMFPEVVQEALMHSFDMPRTNPAVMSGQNTLLSHTSTTPRMSHAPMISSQINTPVCTGPVPAQRPSFPIQELLSNLSQGEFPASTLLSAAAKAQFAQQQHHLSMLMAHHLAPLSATILPSCTQPGSTLVGSQSQVTNNTPATSGLPLEKCTSTQNTQPTVAKTSSSITTDTTVQTSTEKAKRTGATKISELLSRNECNKQGGRPAVEMLNLIHQLQRHGSNVHSTPEMKFPQTGQTVPSQPLLSGVANQNAGAMNLTNFNAPMIATVGNLLPHGQHTALVDQQLLQMYNALGFSFQNTVPQQKQQLPTLETGTEAVTSVSVLNQQQLVNAHLHSSSQLACSASSVSSNPTLLLRQQDPIYTNVMPNATNFVPLLGNPHGSAPIFNLQGIQPPSNISTLLQQQPAFSQTQPSIHGNNTHVPQLQSNQSINVPNLGQDQTQNPLTISNPLAGNSGSQAVMNMLNIQQSIGNGTNLTAMQLQTLQLQQQLLQQLQQVQGMQHLISQYNLQNIAVNNSCTGEKKVINTEVTATIANNVGATEPSRTATGSAIPAVLPNVDVAASAAGEVSHSNAGEGTRKDEVTMRKSNTVRVIAAADTTEDCSSTTRTVDIGTETDAIDEENSEVHSECDNEDVQEEDHENPSHSDSGSDNESCGKKDDITDKDQSSKALPATTFAVSRVSNLNTCLAIATQKGTTRSSELESRLFGEKSSLARSQNLSAELTKPTGSELKLKIKRKRLLESSVERAVESVKKVKSKEKKEQVQFFEKKELRSSTLAATKASSSLAAVISAGKDASRLKDSHTDGKPDLKNTSADTDPKPSCSKDEILGEKDGIREPKVSTEYLECDSSVDSQTSSKITKKDSESAKKENLTSEIVAALSSQKKENLTSQIAAALSSQKGLWQLSSPKKVLPQATESQELTQTFATTEGCFKLDGKGVNHPEDENSLQMEEREESMEDCSSEKEPVIPRSFSTGDLVWGQIRGFPSWPGKLVDNTEPKCGETIEGKVFVKWFGDNTVTQVEPNKLKTLSEGLEAHHRARKKHRRGRKMNSNLEQAIQQAMAELDRKTTTTGGSKETDKTDKGIKQTKVKQKK